MLWLQGIFNLVVLLPLSMFIVWPFFMLFELVNLTAIIIKALFCWCWCLR
jgi:hypothetical protein